MKRAPNHEANFWGFIAVSFIGIWLAVVTSPSWAVVALRH